MRSLIQILSTATSYILVGTTEVMFWHAKCSAIISYTSIGQWQMGSNMTLFEHCVKKE